MIRLLLPAGLLLLGATAPALPEGVGGAAPSPPPVEANDVVVYHVKANENLPQIARQWFIDPENWRALQALNRIADPLHVAEGTRLQVRRSWLRTLSMSARVVHFRGNVDVVRDGSARPVGKATVLREGDILRTGRAGYATLELPDASRVSLPSASRIRIDRLRQLPMSREVDRRFVLESGHVDAKVTPMTNPKSGFLIRTPVAVAAVRGTQFQITYTPDDQRMTTEVREGRVEVRLVGRAEQVLLSAGFGTVATPGRLMPAISLLAPPVLQSPEAVQDGSMVRFRLQPVSGAAGYIVEIASDAEFTDRLGRVQSNGPTASFSDIANGRYYVRASAVDGYGLSGRPVVLTFERRQPGADGRASEGDATGIVGLSEVIAAAQSMLGLADWFPGYGAQAGGVSAASTAAEADAGDAAAGPSAAEESALATFSALSALSSDDLEMSGIGAFGMAQAPLSRGGQLSSSGSGSAGGSGGSGGAGGGRPGSPSDRDDSAGGSDSGVTIIPTDPAPVSPFPPGGSSGDGDSRGNGGPDFNIPDSGWNSNIIVPEPASWVLMITGFGVVGGLLRGRRRRAACAG